MSFEARYLLYNLFFHLILFLVLNDLMVGWTICIPEQPTWLSRKYWNDMNGRKIDQMAYCRFLIEQQASNLCSFALERRNYSVG